MSEQQQEQCEHDGPCVTYHCDKGREAIEQQWQANAQLRLDLKAAQQEIAEGAEIIAERTELARQLRAQRDQLQARIDAAPEYWAVKKPIGYPELFISHDAAKHFASFSKEERVYRVRVLEIPDPPTLEPEVKE